MGNWEKQQEVKKETRERERTSREVLGKFFYDLAKLIFAAMVMGGIVPLFMDSIKFEYGLLFVCGGFATTVFASIGYNIIKK